MFAMAVPTAGHPNGATQPQLHWLAGLLEGEGSFLKGPPSAPRHPVIALQMTDEDVVQRVGTMFGRKVTRWQARNENWQATYCVRITGSKAVAWMTALRPLMGIRRRVQIDAAVASYDPKPASLLDDESAARALQLLASGRTVRDVAEQFGTSIWCMYDLRGGRTHRDIPRP